MLKEMKTITFKRACLLGLSVITLFSMSACSQGAFNELKNANDKMDTVKSGHTELKIKMDNTFDTTLADEEALKVINYLKSVTIDSNMIFDEDQQQFSSNVYANIGGLGVDVTLYKNKDQLYLKYPVMKKYIDLKQIASSNKDTADFSQFKLEKSTTDALEKQWDTIATAENVKAGEPTVITVKDKQVKATAYKIDVQSEQMKEVMKKSMEIILKDPNIIKMVAQKAMGPTNSKIKASLSLEDMNRVFSTMTLDQINLTDYVDADGFVLQKTIDIAYSNLNEKIQPSATHISIQVTNTDLNQPVKVDMPAFNAENVYTQEELNKDLPAVFKTFGQ